MEELEKKYNLAIQTLATQIDSIFTLQIKLESALLQVEHLNNKTCECDNQKNK